MQDFLTCKDSYQIELLNLNILEDFDFWMPDYIAFVDCTQRLNFIENILCVKSVEKCMN